MRWKNRKFPIWSKLSPLWRGFAMVRADYVRTRQRESWIGVVVGLSFCGLIAIVVSLALAERAEVGHWIWLDTAALAFSAISLFMLGSVVALLPAFYYEWWRAIHIDPLEDE